MVGFGLSVKMLLGMYTFISKCLGLKSWLCSNSTFLLMYSMVDSGGGPSGRGSADHWKQDWMFGSCFNLA